MGGKKKAEEPTVAPAAKRLRQEEGRAAGGAAAAIQEMVAEVVQIKKEKLDAALKRQAEDAKAMRSKVAEVASPSPSSMTHVRWCLGPLALLKWVSPGRLLTRRAPRAGEGAPREAAGSQRAPHHARTGSRVPSVHG